MKQRVQDSGLEGLCPHELVEFLLYYSIPRQDVNALAHRLIERFGSVRDVIGATPEQLRGVQGVGERTARWLALVGEATFASERLQPEDRLKLSSCSDAFRYAVRVRRELRPPSCVQLCLDVRGRLLYRNELCPSLNWGEPELLRAALRDMLSSHAYSAILLLMSELDAPEPEEYDIVHARDYAAALQAADCALLDVILVGREQFSSLRKLGAFHAAPRTSTGRALHEAYVRDMPGGALLVHDFEQ